MFEYSANFAALGKYIDRHVSNYLKQLHYSVGKGELGLTSMWVNCMPKGSYHTNHIHPLSVISGTYYLFTDAKSGAIKFEDARMVKFMNSPRQQEKTPLSRQRYYQIQPKTGDVVLFESWQGHEVLENKSDKNRISISFNYGWL